MKRSILLTAALIGAALSFTAMLSKGSSLELRVYLRDKTTGTPADLEEWSASIQVETRGGRKKTHTLMLTQPRPDDRIALGHEGQSKEVEGTSWSCELVVLKPAPKRDLGKEPPDEGRAQERKPTHPRAGPYFKAELSEDEKRAEEFTATVVLRHKGETMTVTGFRYPLFQREGEAPRNGKDAPEPGDPSRP